MDEDKTSEEYEEIADQYLKAGNAESAQVAAMLALVAVIRESVFVVAELIDPTKDGDDDEDDEDDEPEGIDD